MKHVVFLLHGMGTQLPDPEGWHKEFVDSIKAAWGQYSMTAETQLEDRYEFVSINYDQIFRQLVKTWADNAQIVGAMAGQIGGSAAQLKKLTKWLEGAGELGRNNFGWTHAADVLLYRAFDLVQEHVCTHVANQLITKINAQHKESNRSKWSVIAHSLGTAVLHDTLARWTSYDPNNPHPGWPGGLAFSPANEQADVIMMVANVSKVLERSPYDAYGRRDAAGNFTASVAPGFAGQAGRICLYYLTVRNKYDPFTIPSMFAPENWPDDAALLAKPPRYVYREVDHLHNANPHDFGHYMKHPDVHVPLFRRLATNAIISDEEWEEARNKFRKFGSVGDEAAFKLRKSIQDRLPKLGDDWQELGAIWKWFFE